MATTWWSARRASRGYWWGNLVLLGDAPAARRCRDWEQVFTTCHPGAMHRAFGVDGVSGESAGCEDLVRQGCTPDVSDVMTASVVREPPHPHRRAVCRSLDLARAADFGAAVAVRLANAPRPLPAGHEEFASSVGWGRCARCSSQVTAAGSARFSMARCARV
ncbi:MAG TPA: hypothetical protein VMV41_16440, partial [Cellulomonadaceae bacterium]|nr:hypothetical protein [Cellulomonadaceae bacterium]